MQDTQAAFHWIIELLQKHSIPFRITGGFAARIYGANRPLYDIDIEVPDEAIKQLTPDVQEYIIYGPQRYTDNEFDLELMTLRFQGQEIDICGMTTDKIHNKEAGQWEQSGSDLQNFTMVEYDHVAIPIIPWQELVAYKKKIRRDTDLEDVQAIEKKQNV